MQIEQERIGSALVLKLSGSFGETAPELEDVLTRLVREGEADIIVDLSAAEEFRALRSLVKAERLRREAGGMHRLAIVAAEGGAIGERLLISGMRKTIPVFGSIEDLNGAWETDGFPA